MQFTVCIRLPTATNLHVHHTSPLFSIVKTTFLMYYFALILCMLISTVFFPHMEHMPFLYEQSLQKLCRCITFALQMRHIVFSGIYDSVESAASLLFVFPSTFPPDIFLAPSFHLSGTISLLSFPSQESHTIRQKTFVNSFLRYIELQWGYSKGLIRENS